MSYPSAPPAQPVYPNLGQDPSGEKQPPPAYQPQPPQQAPGPYPYGQAQAGYAAPPQQGYMAQQQGYPPPPPGYNQPTPGLPMGIAGQQGFREDDPRWNCMCGMHARTGTIVICAIQLFTFTFYFGMYAIGIYQRRQDLFESNVIDYSKYVNVTDQEREELDALNERANTLRHFWQVVVLIALVAFIIFFAIAPFVLGIIAARKDNPPAWMIWPALIIFGLFSGCAIISCNCFGIVDCIGFYTIMRFKEYLRFKAMHDAQQAQGEATATTSQPGEPVAPEMEKFKT